MAIHSIPQESSLSRTDVTSNWITGFPPPDELAPYAPFWGIQQSEIDIATGALLTEPRRIWGGTGGRYPEAPHLYAIGGRYYLLIAEGGTELGHMVTLARSDSPWGPWEPCPHNPILTHRSYHSPFQALGHADLVEAHDGSWWLVCLGIRPQGMPAAAHLGRETFLAPVRWDDAGWPVVGEGGRLRVELAAPAFVGAPAEPAPPRDDFDAPQLSVAWSFLDVPAADTWSLADRTGALRLMGGPARLDDGPPVAFVGRRQEHLRCSVATELDFEPAADGGEAGLTVWMNPSHHYDLFVTWRAGQRHAILRRRIGSLVAEVADAALQPGPVVLAIEADAQEYRFAVAQGADRQALGTAEARYLAPEIAGGFTGVMLGLYAAGSEEGPPVPAFFEWFDYHPAA